MDKLTIEISYNAADDEAGLNEYSDGPTIAKTAVQIARVPEELRGALTARIIADAHRTIVAQQVGNDEKASFEKIAANLADELKRRGIDAEAHVVRIPKANNGHAEAEKAEVAEKPIESA